MRELYRRGAGRRRARVIARAAGACRLSRALYADGDFVVTGSSGNQDGSASGAYGQRYNAAGAAQGAEFRANTTTSGNQSSPKVAVDADGDFVVAWASEQDGSSYGIYAQRYGPDFTVTAAEFIYQSPPHRLPLTFSRGINPLTLHPADLLVRLLPGGTPFVPTSVEYDPATKTATFVLTSQFMANGNYRATLASGAVSDPSGNPVSGPFTADFFSLIGDINRDRRVDATDFSILASNFGKTNPAIGFGQGELTGNQFVDATDFALLAGNFGKAVPVPAPAPALVAPPGAPGRPRAPRSTPRGGRRSPRRAGSCAGACPQMPIADVEIARSLKQSLATWYPRVT